MKNFALTGVAGYIAPRHLKAIKETGSNLVAALDPHDSVGILDQFFPDTAFFTEFERFDRHIEMLKRKESDFKLDYVSICSPNNLHDAHIRFALRVGADAICEKPLVLNPWNLDALEALEKEFQQKIYTVLQLRLHPSIIELKKNLLTKNHKPETKHRVTLKYITSRGLWYNFSWKGDIQKSGGIATNIGIHFFDLLIWLFGDVEEFSLNLAMDNKMGGTLSLKNADVDWFLSIDPRDLPEEALKNNKRTYRSIKIDGKEIEFTEGFTDLHTEVYKNVLSGGGFGINDSRPSIELVQKIREKAKKFK
ncbi:MAG TPA: Gfo/Idh/MocA family oxidoreductase [Melioribacteraceae bacterium]|nr:Gfo/Idh/MocA family oxidoreductase [Melioribacteraceae bacterium]